jgi:hypothetical protein
VPHAVVTNVRVESDCDQKSDSAVALHQFLLDLKVGQTFAERSVQKLGGLPIIKVRAFHIATQNRFRISLIHACVDNVDL